MLVECFCSLVTDIKSEGLVLVMKVCTLYTFFSFYYLYKSLFAYFIMEVFRLSKQILLAPDILFPFMLHNWGLVIIFSNSQTLASSIAIIWDCVVIIIWSGLLYKCTFGGDISDWGSQVCMSLYVCALCIGWFVCTVSSVFVALYLCPPPPPPTRLLLRGALGSYFHARHHRFPQ